MNRRTFVRNMCYGGIATCALPSVSFAQVNQRGRLVFVLLRGGFDGLAAVVPYGDPDYRTVRATFAFNESELAPLDDTFGLAPGLSPLRALWDNNELAVLHAMAIPHRTRSHFDGQAILETGLDRPVGSSDGWLNRLLQVMSGQRSGIAIAAGMPLSLTGPFEVESWSPTRLGAVDDAFLERLAVLYRADPMLHGRFEAALQQQDLVGEETDGPRERATRRYHPAHAGGRAHIASGAGTEHRRHGIQRVGYAREPGHGGRRARSTARSARGRAPRISDRDGERVADHDSRRDDGVRTHGSPERHERNRPWNRGRRIRTGATARARARRVRLARPRTERVV